MDCAAASRSRFEASAYAITALELEVRWEAAVEHCGTYSMSTTSPRLVSIRMMRSGRLVWMSSRRFEVELFELMHVKVAASY